MKNKVQTFKLNLFLLIEPSRGNIASKIFDTCIMTLIGINVLSVILESVQPFYIRYQSIFKIIEYVSVSVFTFEYISRIWVCTIRKRYKHPIAGRLKYALSFYLIIDLVAILPFYLPFLFAVDMRFLRILRLFRIARIFKLGRYSKSFRELKYVFNDKKEELAISLFIGFILLIVSACLMYYAEKNYQPEVFSNIPQALWWAVCTLTTVGYGDMYPISMLGKIIASFISVLGIGLLALPAGIFASGFADYISRRKNKSTKCPHCGKDIHG